MFFSKKKFNVGEEVVFLKTNQLVIINHIKKVNNTEFASLKIEVYPGYKDMGTYLISEIKKVK